MKLDKLIEAKDPATTAVKIWLKISDLMTDLEDELLDIASTNPSANKALGHLRNNELAELHQELRHIIG